MLPTHVIRVEAQDTGPSMASAHQNQHARLNDGAAAVYPPTTAGNGGVADTNVSYTRRRSGKKSLQELVFGRRGVTALTVDASELAKQGDSSPTPSVSTASSISTKPPRWRTPEFCFYYVVFILAVPYMVWIPIQLSDTDRPNFWQYSRYMERGWIFGRLRDNSDFQYRSFRDYVGFLFGILVAQAAFKKIFERLTSTGSANARGAYQQVGSGDSDASITHGFRNRSLFLGIFTAVFILALHGTNTIKLLICCGINYVLAKRLAGTPLCTPSIWTFNVVTLFAVHYYEGFDLASMSDAFAFFDMYKGLLKRWQINYNITMLRMVSFALDYHWARKQVGVAATPSSTGSDSRSRAANSHPLEQYTFTNYLLYALYPPLFIAGPIMTFNDFHSQLLRPLAIPKKVVLSYAIRFIVCLMTMEFILHFMYVNAIKEVKAWYGSSPVQLSMIGFWNLIIVWLKLLIPWRFFRLWAMVDGIDAPENMIRCMANNYSTLGFWRSWHRSYNLWIVRYIYVPVGGAKRAVPATLLVFTFVGLWHDLSLKLLTWAWLVTFFIVPELTCRALLPEKKYGNQWWYRHVAAFGGVLNVLMMMTANLVGFVIGVEGIQYMWETILSSMEGVKFLFTACAILFVGVQVMFEYREEELRRGVSRKC